MPKNNDYLRGRKTFSALEEQAPLPNLIEVQRRSYEWFLEEGLKELLDEINPVQDFTSKDLELYLEDYYLDEPRFDERTEKQKISLLKPR